MQKIMFEHRRFGLEQAVIARLKENTRRRVRFPKGINDEDVESALMGIDPKGRVYFTFTVSTHWGAETVDVYPKYQIGEQVAVAQSYETVAHKEKRMDLAQPYFCKGRKGWLNKMYVQANLMPHVIEITDIKAERLQDISNEDCLCEGVMVLYGDVNRYAIATKKDDGWIDFHLKVGKGFRRKAYFNTPREAFSALIDRLNGRGTWERNEWQFAYTFKLIN